MNAIWAIILAPYALCMRRPAMMQHGITGIRADLQGFDRSWTSWTEQTSREYTNLPDGRYRFIVRAKNIYNHLSREAAYPFTIAPPWYRIWWAWFLYGIFALLIVYSVVKMRVRHLEKQTTELEAIVAERTGKIKERADRA